MIKQFLSKQFLLFIITGGIASVFNFVSRIIYNVYINYAAAIVLGYFTGMVVAFLLAKLLVFKGSKKSILKSIPSFFIINLFGVLQTLGVSLLLAYYVLPAIGVKYFALEIAHIFGIAMPVFTSYLGYKYWSFR